MTEKTATPAKKSAVDAKAVKKGGKPVSRKPKLSFPKPERVDFRAEPKLVADALSTHVRVANEGVRKLAKELIAGSIPLLLQSGIDSRGVSVRTVASFLELPKLQAILASGADVEYPEFMKKGLRGYVLSLSGYNPGVAEQSDVTVSHHNLIVDKVLDAVRSSQEKQPRAKRDTNGQHRRNGRGQEKAAPERKIVLPAPRMIERIGKHEIVKTPVTLERATYGIREIGGDITETFDTLRQAREKVNPTL